MSELLTLGEVAEVFHTQVWRVLRLYQRGLLPEPARVGRNRVVARADLATVRAALEAAGYLPKK